MTGPDNAAPFDRPKTVYKLTFRFEIQKMSRSWWGPEEGNYSDNWTQERLTIEDSIDLGEARTLTEVLKKVDQIHEVFNAG